MHLNNILNLICFKKKIDFRIKIKYINFKKKNLKKKKIKKNKLTFYYKYIIML
ncbi:hypothetical protein [Buchnera aphidicola]|uniref:hypothetical protein n=1 Tax=Buchnera aphidicola TaxID=9 RepID=UPI0031B89A97